jgi:hypothetical protein
LGLAFGAADQQLGTLTAELGPWTSTAAQMSAPWLVLPFLIGLTQSDARRAAVLGLVVTASALVGYFAMTYSPLEIHPWTLDRFTSGFVAVTTSGYNPLYVLGGLVTGPLFGLLGQRWRLRRSWVSRRDGCRCPLPRATGSLGFGSADAARSRLGGGGRVRGRRCRTLRVRPDGAEAPGVSIATNASAAVRS